MTDPFEDSTAQPERLVAEAIKETDSAKYDELCTEIWRVLSQRETSSRNKCVMRAGTFRVTAIRLAAATCCKQR
jgi:hypothetical protein